MEIKNLKAYLANENIPYPVFAEKCHIGEYYLRRIANGDLIPGPKVTKLIHLHTNGLIYIPHKPKESRKNAKKQHPNPEHIGGTV